jgi:hypothetical protein
LTQLPQSLAAWTLDTLRDLLAQGVYESDLFDIKEKLPDPRDREGKERLSTTCAALANASGGFLIFGVSDDRSMDVDDRLVGVDPGQDLPEHFGNLPAACEPTVSWEFRNPPLRLPSGRVIHVIYIPPSWRAPHSVGLPSAMKFPHRSNKGNEYMSYSEVSRVFLGSVVHDRRLRLFRRRRNADGPAEGDVRLFRCGAWSPATFSSMRRRSSQVRFRPLWLGPPIARWSTALLGPA